MAIEKEITATLVVTFPGEGDAAASVGGQLVAKIDDRFLGLNGGKTSFVVGDAVGFLVYKGSTIGGLTIRSSVGNILNVASSTTEQIIETLVFSNSDSVSPSFPVFGGLGKRWLGRSGGGLALQSDGTLKTGAKVTAVVEVTYNTRFSSHLLSNITNSTGKSEFPVVISIVGTING